MSAAWHGAYLERVEARHFPALDKFLNPPTPEEDRVALAEDLKAALMRVRPTGRGDAPPASPETSTQARAG